MSAHRASPDVSPGSWLDAEAEAFVVMVADGRIVGWNRAAEAMFGWTREDALGSDIADLLLPVDLRTDCRAAIDRCVADGEERVTEGRTELAAVHRDGHVVVAEMRLCVVDSDDRTRVAALVRNVSESRRGRERLAEAESRFAGAFDAASTGMALTALDGRFLAVNPALCRFLARDAETLLASSVQEVTHTDDLPADIARAAQARAGEIDSFQQAKRYLLPGGGIVWGLLTITMARDSDGAPRHYVSQVEDITARKTSEGELQRYATQLQALSAQDPLTGLLNRRAFGLALVEELRVLSAGGRPCTVLMVAVDGDDAAVAAAARSLVRASRDADHMGHLGNGELVALLPSVDGPNAPEIVERIGAALGQRGVCSSHATASPGENAVDLLQRIRAALPDSARPHADGRAPRGPEGLARLLELARTQLGMAVSFLTRLDGDGYVFVRIDGKYEQLGVVEGAAMPMAGSHCQRMLEGRIASTVPDLAADPLTRDLELTRRMGLRA